MALAQQPEAQNAGRGVVRQRSEDELEPCVFPLEDGSLSQEHRVRSQQHASSCNTFRALNRPQKEARKVSGGAVERVQPIT